MKRYTVSALLTDTSIIRKPLYYGQFVWSQKCQKSYIPYLWFSSGSVPLVSVLKRFDYRELVSQSLELKVEKDFS